MSKKSASRSAKPSAADTRAFSSIVVDGIERAPSRGMLYATGFKKEDFKKSQVGVASTWSMVTPCNMHIDQLAKEAEAGANAAGGRPPCAGPLSAAAQPGAESSGGA